MKKSAGIEFVAKANLPTCFGVFTIYAFRDSIDQKEHIALVSGKLGRIVNARIHSKCLTGDGFCSLRCDCRAQLETALRYIGKFGGVLIYLDQEGRGIGLANKIKAYALQEQGYDTLDANLQLGFPADMRRYDAAAGILNYLKIKRIRLLTNNPKKLAGLEQVEVVERVPIYTTPTAFNRSYIETKKKRMGHL
jgi:GTP cyclohydrolase II